MAAGPGMCVCVCVGGVGMVTGGVLGVQSNVGLGQNTHSRFFFSLPHCYRFGTSVSVNAKRIEQDVLTKVKIK